MWGDSIYVTTSVAESGKAALVTGDAGINSAQDVVRHTWHLLAIDKASAGSRGTARCIPGFPGSSVT